jgi:hypothetical protein
MDRLIGSIVFAGSTILVVVLMIVVPRIHARLRKAASASSDR